MSDVENELNDAELFNDAMTETPVETPEPEIAAVEQPALEQPRDEQGKFAAKDEPAPEIEAEKPTVDDNAPLVPSWRVREINEEKRTLAEKVAKFETEQSQWQREQQELRTRLAALEKPAQPKAEAQKPDPLLDPEGYEAYLEKRFEDRLLSERRESSLQQAHRTYKGEFEEAYAAAQKQVDPVLQTMMQNSRDPGETLVQWHREQKTKAEVGNDPNAWLEKKLEERLNDPAFLAKAMERARGVASPQTNGKPNVQLPPSLNNASRANASLVSADDNDDSDEALFKYAMS